MVLVFLFASRVLARCTITCNLLDHLLELFNILFLPAQHNHGDESQQRNAGQFLQRGKDDVFHAGQGQIISSPPIADMC